MANPLINRGDAVLGGGGGTNHANKSQRYSISVPQVLP